MEKSIFKVFFSSTHPQKEISAEVPEQDPCSRTQIKKLWNEGLGTRSANTCKNTIGYGSCVPDCISFQKLQFTGCTPSLGRVGWEGGSLLLGKDFGIVYGQA